MQHSERSFPQSQHSSLRRCDPTSEAVHPRPLQCVRMFPIVGARKCANNPDGNRLTAPPTCTRLAAVLRWSRGPRGSQARWSLDRSCFASSDDARPHVAFGRRVLRRPSRSWSGGRDGGASCSHSAARGPSSPRRWRGGHECRRQRCLRTAAPRGVPLPSQPGRSMQLSGWQTAAAASAGVASGGDDGPDRRGESRIGEGRPGGRLQQRIRRSSGAVFGVAVRAAPTLVGVICSFAVV